MQRMLTYIHEQGEDHNVWVMLYWIELEQIQIWTVLNPTVSWFGIFNQAGSSDHLNHRLPMFHTYFILIEYIREMTLVKVIGCILWNRNTQPEHIDSGPVNHQPRTHYYFDSDNSPSNNFLIDEIFMVSKWVRVFQCVKIHLLWN